MSPRIAIPTPTANDADYNLRSWQSYADAVAGAGGDPVRVDLDLSRIAMQALLDTCSGVCLPGSPADVDPIRYGADRDEATSPADPLREATDFVLLDDALKKKKPVLAICYGMQSMNVWRGGTLVQDLMPLPVNHSAGRAIAIAHAVIVPPQSLFGRLLQQDEAPLVEEFLRLPVNTSHHQAVGEPGVDLRICGRCPDDGVVEAMEADVEFHPFMLGVQWHPERSVEISAASRALFRALVSRA